MRISCGLVCARGVCVAALAVFAICGSAAAEPVRFDNHLIVEVDVDSTAALAELQSKAELLECHARQGANRFLIRPDQLAALDGHVYKILHTNAQALIDAEAASRAAARALRGPAFFADYATFTELNAYIDTLVALRPDIASKVPVGTSLEGRAIWGLVLQSQAAAPAPRPQLVITGCQHAREWISPMSVMYAADTIVRGYGTDPEITALLDRVEFHFVPMVNPDGYVYSHTTNRMWRKNRRPNGGASFGVDLNRNWSVGWGSNSSGNSFDPDFRGPAAFSEPESTALRDYMSTLTNFRGHLDIHSYSQLILGPWGHTDNPSPRRDELFPISRRMSVAIEETHGVPYAYGFGSDVLYLAGGVMPDWTFQQGALSWTYELRDDGSQFGFVLPPGQIVPNAEEVFEGIKILAEAIQRDVEFSFPQGRRALAPADTPTSVNVTLIQWNDNLVEPNSVRVFSRVGAGPFVEAAPVLTGLSFAADLPAISCGQVAEYYFTARTTTGRDVRAPADPNGVFELRVGDATVVLDDDFEQDNGWETAATAVDGQWQRATPAGGGDRADPASDFDGSGAAFVTDNADGNSDVDNGEVILTSPALDLSEGGQLTWAYWLDSLDVLDASDYMLVEYATDAAGVEWTLHRAYETPLGAWRTDALAVGGSVPASATFRIRFIARDTGNGDVIEAALDAFEAVRFTACADTPCVGDLDGSGMVDLGDLSGLLAAFGTCDGQGGFVSAADLDGSGCVDLADLSGLLGVFGASCE